MFFGEKIANFSSFFNFQNSRAKLPVENLPEIVRPFATLVLSRRWRRVPSPGREHPAPRPRPLRAL